MNEPEPEKPQPPKPPTHHFIAPFLIAGVCGVLGVWLLSARPSFWGLAIGGLALADLLVGFAAGVLAFTLPVCLLILLGRPPIMTLSPLLPFREERAKWAEMRQRPMLSDDEFYKRFYADSGVVRQIPIRLRLVYATQLGMDRVLPGDKAIEFDSELDLADLLAVVEETFNVKLSDEETLKLDGSFDSIVRLVASKQTRSLPAVEQEEPPPQV